MAVRKNPLRDAIASDHRLKNINRDGAAAFETSSAQEEVAVHDEANPKRPRKEHQAVYRVRLPKKEVEIFQGYLDRQGMSLSAGIRTAVFQYMAKMGLK